MINNERYIVRKRGTSKEGNNYKGWRDWWLIKFHSVGTMGDRALPITIGPLSVPSRYIGRKVRFKMEVIGEEDSVQIQDEKRQKEIIRCEKMIQVNKEQIEFYEDIIRKNKLIK